MFIAVHLDADEDGDRLTILVGLLVSEALVQYFSEKCATCQYEELHSELTVVVPFCM